MFCAAGAPCFGAACCAPAGAGCSPVVAHVCHDVETPWVGVGGQVGRGAGGVRQERSDRTDRTAGEANPAAEVQLVKRLDERLCKLNIEYASKRDTLRLGPVRLELVQPGFWAQWEAIWRRR